MKDETLETLGTILTKKMGRDAIHIAVIQCTAAQDLPKGVEVGIVDFDKMLAASVGAPMIGIVDPFLSNGVLKGQMFWLYLFPRTITSLKHHWTHPNIPDEKRDRHPSGLSHAEAEDFLREFAAYVGADFPDLIQEVTKEGGGVIETGYHMVVQDWTDISDEDRQKFWDSVEIMADRKFNADHRSSTYFNCTC